VAMPANKNRILVRLENIADYNKLQSNNNLNQSFNLKKYLDRHWKKANANSGIDYEKIEILETTITGNMKIEDINKRKLEWRGK